MRIPRNGVGQACVVGGLDAYGNTIASCGIDPSTLSPTDQALASATDGLIQQLGVASTPAATTSAPLYLGIAAVGLLVFMGLSKR